MSASNIRTSRAAGDCFAAAGKFIARDEVVAFPKDYRLVHGNLRRLRQDVEYNHAWVEEGELVHDVSNGRHKVIDKFLYYNSHGVTNVRRYTPEEALAQMIRTRHWGPWE